MAWNNENIGCFDKSVRLCFIAVNKDLKILTSTMNGALVNITWLNTDLKRI